MIEFTLATSPDQIAANLQLKAEKLLAAIMLKVDIFDAQVQQRAQQKVSGEVLQVRTGKLLRSIEMIPAVQESSTITGAVQAGGGVAYYAKFQEEGTGPYVIEATKAKALAFLVGGKQVFAKKVNHPGLNATHFMHDSLWEMAPELQTGLQEAIVETSEQNL